MAYDYTLVYSKINYDGSLNKIMSIDFTTTTGLTVGNFTVKEVASDGTESTLANAAVTESTGTYTATLNTTNGIDVGKRVVIQYADTVTPEYSNKLFVDTVEEFSNTCINNFAMKLPQLSSEQLLQFDLDKVDGENFSNVDTTGIVVKAEADKPSGTNSTIEYADTFKPYLTHFAGDDVELKVSLKKSDGTAAPGDFEVTIQDQSLTSTSVTFNPADTTTDVAITVTPTLSFSRAIKKLDGTVLQDADITTDIITFADNSGNPVAYTATINANKDLITITPTASLSNSTEYTITLVNNAVRDSENIKVATTSATFTTIA